MEIPKISVILITYNRANFLPRMLDSLLAQKFKYFEIILINNGSTDNTKDICREYKSRDSKIKIFEIEENNGPSIARNLGLDKAKAEYVCLVDDDDYCEPGHLMNLYDLSTKFNSDISITGCYDDFGTKLVPKYEYDEIYVWNKEEAVSEFLKREKFNAALATKLFKKSLFDEIRFLPDVLIDDIHVVYKLFVKADRVASRAIPTYMFYKHEGNVSGFIEKDFITKELLQEYLEMQAERVNYISKNIPELESQVKYAKWSYMISMLDKVKSGKGIECDELAIDIKKELNENKQEFLSSIWITEREEKLMSKYITNEE